MEYHASAMEYWYRGRLGRHLFAMERAQLEVLLPRIFGDYLLHIGGPCDLSAVASCPVTHHVNFSPDSFCHRDTNHVRVDFNDLPIVPGSLDVAVIMHLLEFLTHPQQFIAELFQAMQPNGQVIIIGFNAMSLWGLLRWRLPRDLQPWSGKFLTAGRTKRLLRASGFDIISSKTLCFRPPVKEQVKWQKLLFMEPVGQFLLPSCGAVYCIVAKKRELSMTPLRTTLWSRKANSNRIIQATTRGSF